MIITESGGVFHTEPGSFQTKLERDELKSHGFRFHWEQGSSKCLRHCVGCAKNLPDKVWFNDNFVMASSLRKHFDEAAELALTVARREVKKSRQHGADLNIPCPSGLRLMPYQTAAVEYAMDRKRVLFGDEMGLGKSIMSLAWANAVGASSILIICPASLKINWSRECHKWLVPTRPIHVVDDRSLPSHDALVVIVNYERLIGKSGAPLFENLMRAAVWDLIIIDEAHKLKSADARRTRAILGGKSDAGLVELADRLAVLTGTPIPNRPREIYQMLRALDPHMFGDEWKFLQRYCGPTKSRFWHKGERGPEEKEVWNFDGASNLDELQSRLRASVMVRRLKSEVMTELPDKIRSLVVLPSVEGAPLGENSPFWEQDSQLRELRADVLMAEASYPDLYEASIERLHAAEVDVVFRRMSAEREALGHQKVPHAIEYIQTLLDGGCDKLVVFGHHHSVIEKIADGLGPQATKMYGPMSENARQAAIDRFQTDPSLRVFVGSIQAAGVGITLTAASRVLFVESSWVPSDLSQCEDRVHRIGQNKGVVIEHLVFDRSLDAVVLQRVIAKQRVLDQALDGLGEAAADAGTLEPVSPKPRTPPPASGALRAAVAEALLLLDGVCDGARAKDSMGFSAAHSIIGKRLAAMARKRALSDGEVALAMRFLPSYHRQLPEGVSARLQAGYSPGES